ncbi:Ig-like domain-containing protein [Methanobacterium paludis]|uniref:Polymorphic outer membrane protein n=1 Tax=Methanobacterium paludis (strain DSM 25820 / JCM 18151 / SWAN1) TaxID=868131 RepID=F6D866_METPW|nr:Ig-like domain-containing protein [Methanobacterium paludis]AEG17805.1 polymorphic outer membrane protein [Methanobacterium paludis]
MKNQQILLKIPLILLAVVVLFSFGVNSAAAANTSTIYVNTIGNNNWDGQSAIWDGTSGPKQTITNATGTVAENGTVYIAQGTYKESGIHINTNMTIIGESQQNTIINGVKSGNSIFLIAKGVNVTISNLTLTQGQSNNGGGAIYNNGTLTVTNSTFTDNNLLTGFGGAIFNQGGTLTVTNSRFNNNTAQIGGAICSRYGKVTLTSNIFNNNIAQFGGGAICNYECDLTVANSTFNNNIADWTGGAIMNFGNLTVTNSTFNNNTAQTDCGGAICNYDANLTVTNSILNNNTAPVGGAIYNGADDSSGDFSSVVNFNWIVGNSPNNSEIYSTNGTIDATLNWWGLNVDPSSFVASNVTVTPWLVLNVTVDPTTILNGGNSTVTVDLLHTNNGTIQDPTNGHVPDGIPVNFSTSVGSLNPVSTTLINGQATTTFTANDTALITSTIDNQTVSSSIIVDQAPSNVNVINVNNFAGQNVTLTANVTDYYGNPINGGQINFTVGTTPAGTANVKNGIANLNWTIPSTWTVDSYSITANFDGTGTNYANSTNTGTLTVNPTPTTVVVINLIKLAGQNVTLTANVTDYYGNPVNEGNVTFVVNGTSTNPVNVTNGTATLTWLIPSTWSVGDYNITANYLGTGNYTVSNSTGTLTVTPIPTVTVVDPANNAVNIAVNKVIKVTFNKAIKKGNGWIELTTSNGTVVPSTFSISDNVLIVTSNSTLTHGVKYNVLIHTDSVTDLTGDIVAGYVSRFTTSSDVTAPTVKTVNPINNAVNVAGNKVIKVTFSEAIKAGNGWIELVTSNGTVVPSTWSISGNVLTVKANSTLTHGVKYMVLIHTGSVTDLAGNNVKGHVSRFTVETVAPIVKTVNPINNAVNVAGDKVIKVTFSEAITAGTGWIELVTSNGTVVPVKCFINGSMLTITPSNALNKGVKYMVLIHTGSVTDLAGNNVKGYVSRFTVQN